MPTGRRLDGRAPGVRRDDRPHAHVFPGDNVVGFRIIPRIGDDQPYVGPRLGLGKQPLEVSLVSATAGRGASGKDDVRDGRHCQREFGQAADHARTTTIRGQFGLFSASFGFVQHWLGPLRRSLQHIETADGELFEQLLTEQARSPKVYPLEAEELDNLRSDQVKRADGTVSVTVPKDEPEEEHLTTKTGRESIQIQADLARLGEMMGFRIWIPRNDRSAVLGHWEASPGALLDTLPLNYDGTTLRTVEQIDVIWLMGRAIQRAFEVEHTTAVYSGLLRMADLLALQPNMNIALHIVAPAERREKVLSEIRRPVFSLLEHQPLAERCTFIAYENLREILAQHHVEYMSDKVLTEYEDRADFA